MKLVDLFPEEQFVQAVEGGLVSARPHPTDPLVIYNYTKQCQWQGAWNECTSQCRGLIATTDGEVVARPFPKFFNYGEPDAPSLELDAPARVTDKLDGSLGILYAASDGVSDQYRIRKYRWAIASRGSFESEQAQVGTELLERYLDGSWIPLVGLTYLFEIIYPENRIVVNYGDRRDLVLLAVVDNQTGASLEVTDSWPGPVAETFAYGSLTEALAAPPRPNAEGLVVETGGTRVKIKQADYVALHRIVTGLNERVVWEQLGDDITLDELKAPLPEEFHPWVDAVAARLNSAADQIWCTAQDAYLSILETVPVGSDRKTFALEAQKPEYDAVRPYLFMRLDQKDISPAIWKTLKPAGNLAPRDFAEAS